MLGSVCDVKCRVVIVNCWLKNQRAKEPKNPNAAPRARRAASLLLIAKRGQKRAIIPAILRGILKIFPGSKLPRLIGLAGKISKALDRHRGARVPLL